MIKVLLVCMLVHPGDWEGIWPEVKAWSFIHIALLCIGAKVLISVGLQLPIGPLTVRAQMEMCTYLCLCVGFPQEPAVKNVPASAGGVSSVPRSGRPPGEGNGNPLHIILAWEIPWIEEPGGLQSMTLPRVRHDLATKQQCFYVLELFLFLPWASTPLFVAIF